jgi:hypothetical protein
MKPKPNECIHNNQSMSPQEIITQLISFEKYNKWSSIINPFINIILQHKNTFEADEINAILSALMIINTQNYYTDNLTLREPAWFKKWRYDNRDIRDLPCQDHTKFTKNGAVILEPYPMGMNSIKELIKICDEQKWTFTISGKSFHYPNWTLQIKIVPINKESKKVTEK